VRVFADTEHDALARRVLPWISAAAVMLALFDIGRSPLIRAMKPHWPIESVGVRGELRQVSRQQLEAVISTSLAEDFFAVDVLALRNAAMEMPWVRDASVRRIWPDRVEIHVTERVPAARWTEGGLIDEDGNLFSPETVRGLDTLPELYGPEQSEAKVLSEFHEVRRMLDLFKLPVRAAGVDARGNWRVQFQSGLTLVLGAEPLTLSQRVAQARDALGPRLLEAARIDLRYANGFAVRWRTSETPTKDTAPPRKSEARLALGHTARAGNGATR
jgi:cell division protein FtsQ